MSIDTLASTMGPPTVLKIDVEGAELDVLKGGATTISVFVRQFWSMDEANCENSMFLDKHWYVLLNGEAEHQSPLLRSIWNAIAVVSTEAFAK